MEKTVAQMVTERPSRAKVFEKWGIEFCCGGKRPLDEICAEKGLNADTIREELRVSDENVRGSEDIDWTMRPMSALIENILREHHDYLREELPRLAGMLEHISSKRGDELPHIPAIYKVFQAMQSELNMHMAKEEQILFPMILQLEAGRGGGFHCGSIANPIAVMVREHDDAGNALEEIRRLSSQFTPHEEACATFRALYHSLEELEGDLHRHIHKENHVLFPRAQEAEAAAARA